MTRFMRLSVTALLPALSLLSLSAACFRNPATGKMQLDLLSQSQEVEMGKQAALQAEQSIGLYHDDKLEAFVSDLGKRLSQDTQRKDLPWQFHIVDDPTVNAFALPGGPVFVTRGILAHLNSEAELATVMGHECGHVAARHSANQISKQEIAQLGLGIGAAVSPAVAQLGQVAGAGLQLLFLKYSRDDERQADWLGFGYAANIGYDSTKMVNLMQMLSGLTAESGSGKVPGYLQTHPDPAERLTNVKQRIADAKHDFTSATVNREQYLALIDNMVFGEDPRQGFFKGSLFQHPGLKFQMTFPEGWKTQNQPQAVVAASPQQDAIMQLQAAPKLTPEQAAQQFFSQQGIQRGETKQSSSNGLPSIVSVFGAQTQQGTVSGIISFLSYAGQTWAILGYTSAQALPQYGPLFEKAMASFGPLTDPAALAVQPARLKLVKVEKDMSLDEFNRRHPSNAPPEKIALINALENGGSLKAGQTAKTVVGGPAYEVKPKAP